MLLCNPYINKNEVPPWFAVQMGSVAESVTAKVRLLFELCKEFERKVRKDGCYLTVIGCHKGNITNIRSRYLWLSKKEVLTKFYLTRLCVFRDSLFGAGGFCDTT